MSREYKISSSVIRRRLKKYNIPIRHWKEQKRIDNFKDYEINPSLSGIIDGLIISDAWIDINSHGDLGRLCIEQREDRLEWIEALKSKFSSYGIKSKILNRKKRKKKNYIGDYLVVRKPSVILKTHHYKGFAVQRQRWYQEGVKIIPKDIKLTQHMLANWYCGDGSVDKKGYVAKFYTNNFSFQEVEWLVEKINTELSMSANISKNRGKPIIVLTNYKDRGILHKMIENYIPKCFQYKINAMKVKGQANEQ